MLGNCEKMVVISSTSTNEWPPQPQNQIDHEKGLLMEKANQDQQQPPPPQAPPLKCPRCDSSNTKFCYYNNYSLSQPRHFCKACKRYWTRGGTLRNVPVGGGCRKNKRIKRPSSSASHDATSSPTSAQTTTSNPNSSSASRPHQLDLSSSASHINPLFYTLLTNNHHHSSELTNLAAAYPRFSSNNGTYDHHHHHHHHQPQMSDLGLGFSSGLLHGDVNGNDYRNIINGFNSSTTKQIQDVIPSNVSLLSSYNPIFGSLSSTSTSTIGSLLASSLQRQKFAAGDLKDGPEGINGGSTFHGFEPYEDMQMVRDVKMEDGQSRMEWGVNVVANGQNHIHQQVNSSSDHHDQSLLWNNNNTTGAGVGAWLDPSNMGSSVPSLI